MTIAPLDPSGRIETIKKKAPVKFYAIYLTCLLLFLLAGTEAILRLVFKGQSFAVSTSNEQLVYDPVVGWRARPGLEGIVTQPPFPSPVRVAINSDGFRDEEWCHKLGRADATGAKKILLIGDSMVYGWGSEADGRLSEQLAAIYHVQGERIEVFNAGIPAFGPAQELRLLPELLDYINPDLVLVLFFENDYGDTALPYHHKYPFRVYKPFYDEQAKLVLNETVPKRPSLQMKDTILGRLRLWQAVDIIYYFFQDLHYASYDIPSPRTAAKIYPIRAYDGFVWEDWLKERYPYVERTLLAIYDKMKELSRAHGARFFVASATERVNYAIESPFHGRGIPFIPGPKEEKYYWRWDKVFQDKDHGNFIWGWIVASKIYQAIEGKASIDDFSRLPQLSGIPTEIDLANETESVRYLSRGWGLQDKGGRWLGAGGTFMVRNPDTSAQTLVLVVTGRAGMSRSIMITNDRDEVLCKLPLAASVQTVRCRFGVSPQSHILFFSAFPADGNAESGGDSGDYDTMATEKKQMATIFIQQLMVLRVDRHTERPLQWRTSNNIAVIECQIRLHYINPALLFGCLSLGRLK